MRKEHAELAMFIFLYSFISTLYCAILPIGPGFSEQGYATILRPVYYGPYDYCNETNLYLGNEPLGAASCFFDGMDGNEFKLTCSVYYNVKDIVGIALISSTNGNLYYDFQYPDSKIQDRVVGTFQLSYTEKQSFLNGNYLITITINGCPSALQGYLNADYNVKCELGSPYASKASGLAVSSYSIAAKTLDTNLFYTEISVKNQKYPHTYLIGDNFFFGFSDIYPVQQSINFIPDRQMDLFNRSLTYALGSDLAIPTQGTAQVIEPAPIINFAFQLNGKYFNTSQALYYDNPDYFYNLITTNIGCGLVYLNCDNEIEYFIQHTVNDSTSAYLFTASKNKFEQIYEFDSSLSPIVGKLKLNFQLASALKSGLIFIGINSVTNPEGDIAGQIAAEYPFYSLLNGFQVVDSVTTAAKGCLLMKYLPRDQSATPSTSPSASVSPQPTTDYFFPVIPLVLIPTMDYILIHSVNNAVNVQFNRADIGYNGDTPITLTAISPAQVSFKLSHLNTVHLRNNEIYVSVLSDAYPNGEIRGQVLQPISECTLMKPSPRPNPNFFMSFPLFDDYYSYSTSSSDASSLEIIYFIYLLILCVHFVF